MASFRSWCRRRLRRDRGGVGLIVESFGQTAHKGVFEGFESALGLGDRALSVAKIDQRVASLVELAKLGDRRRQPVWS